MLGVWVVVDQEVCVHLFDHPINERPGSMVQQFPADTTLREVLMVTEAKIERRIEEMLERGMV